jgi:Uma2 family endonuclease
MDDVLAAARVEYPESDGSLIAESDWHRDELFDLLFRLKTRYADSADTYVSGHMFVYYEEGQPASVFAPDVMVVFGVPGTERRVYKLWEEGRAPSVVFEVSSRKTWLVDEGNKRALCQSLGVAEYFLWDPRYEYLTPPLQGFRLVGGAYRALRADPQGCVRSRALGLRLCAEGHRLELYDEASGQRLERPTEAAAAARLAIEAERQRAAEMEERARRAEAEVQRLRAENARLRGGAL